MKEPNWWERFRAWLAYLIFPEPNDWYVEACERANKLEEENAELKRALQYLATIKGNSCIYPDKEIEHVSADVVRQVAMTALLTAEEQEGKGGSLADGPTSKEIRKPTFGNADPVLVSHAFLNTMADKVVQLEEALHQEDHIIIFTDDGWSIQHLVECRPDMTNCEIHKRAQIELGDGACGLKGKYKVLIVDGELDFEKIPE